MNAIRGAAALSLLAALALTGAACDDPVTVGPRPVQPGQAGPSAAEDAGAADAGALILAYRDEDFVESENNRDPFRSYAKLFKMRAPVAPQRTVIMPTTGIDEMRLVAIVSGTPRPRAMLVDTAGVGHVVERGDFVGRPEVVQAGGAESMPVTLNWRVDRIRPGEIVLTREDPTAPNRAPLTRLLPLHEEDREQATIE